MLRFIPPKAKIAIKLALMLGLLVALYVLNKESFVEVVNNLNWGYAPFLFAVVGTRFIELLFSVIRQQALIGSDPRVSFRKLLTISYAGAFANLFLPAGLGLDACRLYYLRSEGMIYKDTGKLIIADKIMALLALLLLTMLLLGVGWGFGLMAFNVPLILLFLGCSTGVAVWLGVFLLDRFSRWSSRLEHISEKLTVRELIRKLILAVNPQCCTNRRIFKALLFAVLGRLSLISGLVILAWPIFGPKGAMITMVCTPIVMLINIAPITPANIGWTEAAAAIIWRLTNSTGGVTIFLMWRITHVLFALPAAGIYFKLSGSGEYSTD